MARGKKANRNREENSDIGRRKVTTRESVAKAQANAAKKGRNSGSTLSASARLSRPGPEGAGMMHCRECGIEFEMSDPLGNDICDGCYEALYEDDDDLEYDEAFADDSPFPELDWIGEWPGIDPVRVQLRSWTPHN